MRLGPWLWFDDKKENQKFKSFCSNLEQQREKTEKKTKETIPEDDFKLTCGIAISKEFGISRVDGTVAWGIYCEHIKKFNFKRK